MGGDIEANERWAIQHRWGERRLDWLHWIAATAPLYNAPLVTHNRGDYLGGPGLNLVSHGEEEG